MQITTHTMELLDDPFGLLTGDRYEFFLQIEVDEEDELYRENGLMLKIIFSADGEENKILQYYFIEKETEKVLDFALEEDEIAMITSYCREHLLGA